MVSNPTSSGRTGEILEIPYERVAEKLGGDTTFRVVDAATGAQVPYQLEYRGQEEPLHLLLQVDVPAGGKLNLRLEKGAPAPVKPMTFARYVPERLDDFAWENDKIAFRMYGKALEGRPGDAHGIDVWTKRTSELVIDKWYKTGDYHADHGEGLDYYSVGLTLGAGDIAPYSGDSLYFPKHYRRHEVLDNGPLRSTFRLDYDEWEAGGSPVKASKTISLDAGSQLSRFEVRFELGGQKELPVAVGIVQRERPGEILTEAASGLMGYWEPEHGKDGITGVGIVFRSPVTEMKLAGGHLMGLGTAKDREPFVYYNGAAWNKAGEIGSAAEWFGYLKDFKARLDQPLVVSGL